ncbi:MAG: AAA family ATPase [Candidatus Solibacter usitatus]|nr:AAA family ATPase [Candidatus Solibacter usitatus]
MLNRLYIDNFRAFVNFEQKFERKQLILGRNGSGKSSLLDGLFKIRQFVVMGDRAEDTFYSSECTLWLNQPRQTWELEADLEGVRYVYRLVIEPWGDPPKPRVVEETVVCAGKPIFEFLLGEVHLFNDRFERKVQYPFDWHRSALATVQGRTDIQILSRFNQWLDRVFVFRLDPFRMDPRAERESVNPTVDLSNFAAWYRHLVQAYPRQNTEFLKGLQSSVDDFSYLKLEEAGENVRRLAAEFEQRDGKVLKFGFGELSEGQRCLICLYAILHFVLATGCTVVLDEPDNFVSLREIQPWLMAADDMLADGLGQLLVISHHPELLNQWAPGSGIHFFRENNGSVRTKAFTGDPHSNLSPAELIARGWERE